MSDDRTVYTPSKQLLADDNVLLKTRGWLS